MGMPALAAAANSLPPWPGFLHDPARLCTDMAAGSDPRRGQSRSVPTTNEILPTISGPRFPLLQKEVRNPLPVKAAGLSVDGM